MAGGFHRRGVRVAFVVLAGIFVALTPPDPVYAAVEKAPTVSRIAINFIDLLVVRPVTLVTTVVGSALYGITYPITFWREDDAALDMLVKAPFDATFRRCLGCPAGES